MAKTRKNPTQLPLPMKKPRGRPALTPKQREDHLPHRSRPKLPKGAPVHITLKTDKTNIKTLRNKVLYKEIRQSMRRAREAGIRIVQFAVLGDHIHMLIEAQDALQLGHAMRAMSISLSKRISLRMKKNLRVLKERYHRRTLTTLAQVRHAKNYIAGNANKHGFTRHKFDWYCSDVVKLNAGQSSRLEEFVAQIRSVLDPPRFYLNKLAT
jgi:REP element-mobilizing transposase RayT